MKITIESTTKIVKADGIDCRVWEGKTERGVEIVCLIPRIAVRNGQDTSQFETELPAVVKKNTKTPGQSTSRLVPRTPARKYHCQ